MPSIDFAQFIAETITSDDNQHFTLMISATTGAGKSWAGIALAEVVAERVAEIKGGKPEDYFDVENIAIIQQEEVTRILETKIDNRYACIGFDDIGVALNSRDFMDNFNKLMNDIYQTFRTRNNFLYFTLPDPMLVDKVPRELVKYHVEIDSSHFDLGYVECKIKHPTKITQINKIIRPYVLDFDGNRIQRHMIFRPSKHLTDEYEKRRSEIEKQNTEAAIESMNQLINKKHEGNAQKTTKFDAVEKVVCKLREQGYPQRKIPEKVEELSQGLLKISVYTVNQICKKNNLRNVPFKSH